MDGPGTFTYIKNGRQHPEQPVYTGDFKNNKKEGHGKQVWFVYSKTDVSYIG